MASHDAWIACRTARPRARVRLFCFPYAGGGASLFRTWSADFPPEIEVCPVQLPGREGRISEPLFERLSPLVAAVDAGLRLLMDKPFAFFGHSMGALIAFELARTLRRRGAPAPVHLFASGCLPPHIPDRRPFHHLSDADLIKGLIELGGMSEDMLQHKELLEFMVPILRADSAVTETNVYTEEAPLRCPITALGGIDDDLVTLEDMAAWRQHTSGAFVEERLPGSHFFLQSARAEVIGVVARRLLATLPGARLPPP